MTTPLTSAEIRAAWIALMRSVRVGVLMTMRDDRPFGSHVPYVFAETWTRVYVHLSRLALHTQHLLWTPASRFFSPNRTVRRRIRSPFSG